MSKDYLYNSLLAMAQETGDKAAWAKVTALEDEAIADLLPADMRGTDGAPRLAAYLGLHPECESCGARGLKVAATTVAEAGDGSLMALCRISAYVLAARRKGWPIRGCDVSGMPNDPEHPWNR
jgi:hypothetical protein